MSANPSEPVCHATVDRLNAAAARVIAEDRAYFPDGTVDGLDPNTLAVAALLGMINLAVRYDESGAFPLHPAA